MTLPRLLAAAGVLAVALGVARPVAYAVWVYRMRAVLPDLRAQAQASIALVLAEN